MKKAFRIVLALALAVLCLTAVAAAATSASGVCDPKVEAGFTSTVTLEAQKADGTAVSTPTEQEGKQVYADAVKVKLTYTGADANAQYMVLVLNDGTTVPTESNVAFIDQANGTIAFDIYPKTLENGKTYDVYLTTDSTTDTNVGMDKKVASFGYYAAFTPGDVNEDGSINTRDAMQCFNHFVGNTTLTGNQFLAADVVTDNSVNTRDAMMILNYFAGNITEF